MHPITHPRNPGQTSLKLKNSVFTGPIKDSYTTAFLSNKMFSDDTLTNSGKFVRSTKVVITIF